MNSQDSERYQYCLSAVKRLKNSNDAINNSMGVEDNHKIANMVWRENHQIETYVGQTQQFITNMEKSYISPAASRRVFTLKQQFMIQKDRRNRLLSALKYTQPTISIEAKQSHPNVCGDISCINETSTIASSASSAAYNSNNESNSITLPADELIDLNQQLITQQSNQNGKKSKIISFLQTKRKKIFYFILFTLLKLGIWLMFFA